MPFWLHEQRIIHVLREIKPRTQLLIVLSSWLIVAATTILYKQTTYSIHLQPIKKLQKICNLADVQSMKVLAHKTERAPLDLRTIPQTLQFFTDSGFHVRRIEKMIKPRSRSVIGYVVCVHGSFESLIKFLTKLKQVPAFRLRLQQVDRISDSKLEVEFFMPGAGE